MQIRTGTHSPRLYPGGVKLHTKILLFMALGVVVGLILQATTDATYIKSSVSIISGEEYVREVLDPSSQRARWIAPFDMIATIFMTLLKMLIVPLILTSIVVGVASLGSGKDFGRLGAKTLGYYMTTSLLAIMTGLIVVNILHQLQAAGNPSERVRKTYVLAFRDAAMVQYERAIGFSHSYDNDPEVLRRVRAGQL